MQGCVLSSFCKASERAMPLRELCYSGFDRLTCSRTTDTKA